MYILLCVYYHELAIIEQIFFRLNVIYTKSESVHIECFFLCISWSLNIFNSNIMFPNFRHNTIFNMNKVLVNIS